MSDQKSPRELLKDYMETNDFVSALRHKAIYTDEIIVGWIESTFLYAYGLQEKENAKLKEKLEIAVEALYICESWTERPAARIALEKIKELDRGGV